MSPASKRVPREQCGIYPRQVCKKVTKLVPQLIGKEYCQKNPAEICQLKFNSSSSRHGHSLQPVVQRYCLTRPEPEPRYSDQELGGTSGDTTTSLPDTTETELEKDFETTTLSSLETTTTEQPTTLQDVDEMTTKREISNTTPTDEETLNMNDDTITTNSSEKEGRRIEDNQPRRNVIELKDVLKNYDNFKEEILSKNANPEKVEGVLRPIKPTILRRPTSSPLTEETTVRGR